MYLEKIHSCCGVVDLVNVTAGIEKKDGAQTFEDVIKLVATAKIRYPVVFFAGPTFVPRYAALAKYIRDNNLGKVTETMPHNNPNSGNVIIAYLWEVNWAEVGKFKPDVKTPVKPAPTVPVQAVPAAPSTAPEAVTPPVSFDDLAQIAQVHDEVQYFNRAAASWASYQTKLARARERVKAGNSNHRERRMVLRARNSEGVRWS